MEKEGLIEKKTGLFLLLTVFFFARTALMVPVQCLMMNATYPYFRFSVESVLFIILLIIFSALSSKLAFVVRDKVGNMAALIYIIAVSDPLFFSTQDNPLKLFADIIILLLILNSLNDKKLVPTGVLFPIATFISTFLVPYSLLGYVPGMIALIVLVGEKTGNEKNYIRVIISGIICAIAGFALNKLLVGEVEQINAFFDVFTFAQESEMNEEFKVIITLVPTVITSILFFTQYNKTVKSVVKKKKKNKIKDVVSDAFFLPALISVVAIFLAKAEGFCAINLLVPAIILTLLCIGDECCIKTMKKAEEYMKSHSVICIVALIAIFAISMKGIINYHSAKQLIFYIRY